MVFRCRWQCLIFCVVVILDRSTHHCPGETHTHFTGQIYTRPITEELLDAEKGIAKN